MEPASPRNMVPAERAVPFLSFVWAVILSAAAASVMSLLALPGQVDELPLAFWVMAGLAVLIDARPFTPAGRRRLGAAILASVCLTFAIMLGWGLGPAIVVQVVAVAVCGARMRSSIWRTGFNTAQHVLALGAAAAVLAAGPELAFRAGGNPSWTDVLAVVAASAAWFAVTYGTVTVAVWLRFGGRWPAMFVSGLGFELLSAGSLLFLSPLLVVAAHLSAALIPLILVPLYAVYRMARLTTAHEKISRLDPLTGLGNRKALLTEVADQIAAHVERATRGDADGHMALLLLDLDRFKRVNDALGHAVGDRLLTEVAKRIATVVRPPATLARLGGDEFAVLAPRLEGTAAARRLAAEIAEALDEPVLLDGLPLDIGGSIGVAVYPEHGTDFETLMRHADVAMYEAKHRGDAVAVYAPEADHNSPERLSLLGDLRTALEVTGGMRKDAGERDGAGTPQLPGAGEIRMYYQPQVAIDTGEVVGVEALLRWRHPDRGMVHPEELIKAAEHTAVMRLLTRRVIDDVIEQLAAWRDAGLPMRAALNVSVRDLHTGDVVDQIEDRLQRYGLPADRLQLEITESALMADPRRVLVTLSRLSRLGIAIALDDFGTGYSSMQHLRRLPLSEVKIDRSFVLGMAEDGDDAAIVRSMIELAGALGLRVVAEGVEDERTWRMLHAAGCHVAQGWFYGRPMPAEEFGVWLSRYRPPVLQDNTRTENRPVPENHADNRPVPESRPAQDGPADDRPAEPGPHPRRTGRRATNRRGHPSDGVPESRAESVLEGLGDAQPGNSASSGRAIRGVARAGAEGDK
ncbi:diguanylate cyclase (GGDEF)-like protein [Catenuloplanes nepalensis]|uniref:Diguanylate cyclase (GGDEF)-like protein n=1 Tax=Catenuloplanes nepalensis TaxID=587533 RepID=A0ABT9N0T2_9ACTN|nr:EAL domain-containing protein [Catenuloplanes nepalensis]MDP9797293.1 diguanylate cyclase (GGDEF)-like protein [Catenuloplanes nepalensis]